MQRRGIHARTRYGLPSGMRSEICHTRRILCTISSFQADFMAPRSTTSTQTAGHVPAGHGWKSPSVRLTTIAIRLLLSDTLRLSGVPGEVKPCSVSAVPVDVEPVTAPPQEAHHRRNHRAVAFIPAQGSAHRRMGHANSAVPPPDARGDLDDAPTGCPYGTGNLGQLSRRGEVVPFSISFFDIETIYPDQYWYV